MDELSTLAISLSMAALGIFLLFFSSNDDDDQDGGELLRSVQKINQFKNIIYSTRIDKIDNQNKYTQRELNILQKFQVFFSLRFSFYKSFYINFISCDFYQHEYLLHRIYVHNIIKDIPRNNSPVKNMISFVISLSSLLANINEITGEVLNKDQPIPIGRVLKTIC